MINIYLLITIENSSFKRDWLRKKEIDWNWNLHKYGNTFVLVIEMDEYIQLGIGHVTDPYECNVFYTCIAITMTIFFFNVLFDLHLICAFH